MIVYHNLKFSKKELSLSKKGSHSRKTLHIVVNCHIQNCGKVTDILFPYPYTCIPSFYIYTCTHTHKIVYCMCVYICIYRQIQTEMYISRVRIIYFKKFFIGYFSLPWSAVILYIL